MEKIELAQYGKTALVIGAAEGLGEAFSRALAKRGMNLVMIDNQSEKMRKLAAEFEEKFNIETLCVETDLADKNAVRQIMSSIEGVDCNLMLYIAAFSRVKPFLTHEAEDLDRFIDVNCRTQLLLLHAFLLRREAGKKSGILLLSSLAGLIGMQYVAPYAATKAFTWNLAESLYHELKDQNVDIMACIAGATDTPAYQSSRPVYGKMRPHVMPAEQVAEMALRKLGSRARFIPGISNRLQYFFLTRMLARKMAASIANRVMFNMYAGDK